MRKRISKILKIIKLVLIVYLLYAFVGGILIFAFPGKHTKYVREEGVDEYYSSDISQDRVVLVEDMLFSGQSRIDMIERAQDTLDIAYHSIIQGQSSDIFFGLILDAANRGVKIRLLLDGFIHSLKHDIISIEYALVNHPNIELRYYEPYNLFAPWTWNNVLHDKFIIVDDSYALTGGRNIGDKYYLESYGEIVKDRDIVVYNTDMENVDGSVLSDIKEYFEALWDSDYTVDLVKDLRDYQKERGDDYARELLDILEQSRTDYPDIYNNNIDWNSISHPTNKITLIYNPITRLNKEPWVLAEIGALVENAEQSVIMQSPYFITTKNIRKYINFDREDIEIKLLTNSKASTPNVSAISGYMKYRKSLADMTTLYEYQGEGSIHGKTYIIDERISIIGTFNMDPRSAFLSTESALVIDSEEFTEELMGTIDSITNQSLEVNSDYEYDYVEGVDIEPREISVFKIILLGIGFLIAYLLVFML